MATIIAGHFQLQETALDVCEAGAHVGSLYSFSELKEREESGAPPRHSGMMVAVAVDGHEEARAIELMHKQGA